MAKSDLIQELLSFKGRARRSEWWLVGIGLYVFQAILALVAVGLIDGAGALSTPSAETARTAAMVGLVLNILVFWPVLAISVKRAHDRGKRGWLPAVYMMLSLAIGALNLIAPDLLASDPTGMTLTTGDLISLFVGLPALIIGLWLLVTLGFLDGTPGSNRYGPSPKSASNYRAPPAD